MNHPNQKSEYRRYFTLCNECGWGDISKEEAWMDCCDCGSENVIGIGLSDEHAGRMWRLLDDRHEIQKTLLANEADIRALRAEIEKCGN